MFDYRVVGKVLGPNREVKTESSRKFYNEEFCDLNSSPDIINVIKCRRMRWKGICNAWGRTEIHLGFWLENLRQEDRLGDLKRRTLQSNIKMCLNETV